MGFPPPIRSVISAAGSQRALINDAGHGASQYHSEPAIHSKGVS